MVEIASDSFSMAMQRLLLRWYLIKFQIACELPMALMTDQVYDLQSTPNHDAVLRCRSRRRNFFEFAILLHIVSAEAAAELPCFEVDGAAAAVSSFAFAIPSK